MSFISGNVTVMLMLCFHINDVRTFRAMFSTEMVVPRMDTSKHGKTFTFTRCSILNPRSSDVDEKRSPFV